MNLLKQAVYFPLVEIATELEIIFAAKRCRWVVGVIATKIQPVGLRLLVDLLQVPGV